MSSSRYCTYCGTSNDVQEEFCVRCGQALLMPVPARQAQADNRTLSGYLLPDHLLNNRYRILSRLGEGGMGKVYKAVDTRLNRPVALKEVHTRGLNSQELQDAITAFQREAQILARLDHIHLPVIHDHFSYNEQWYLVMNFIEGKTLAQYLETMPGEKLSVREALDIGIQLCSVLDYLHNQQQPIIFRDLKPANIMRKPDGHLYLIDFGIARHFKQGQAKDTMLLGSPGYAAPEQYGKSQTTALSDIYSLGATLHQLLSGDEPTFSPFQFAPLRQRDNTIPAELATLIMSMVEMDMTRRPASAAIVKQKLQQIAASLAAQPQPPPAAQPPLPPLPPASTPRHDVQPPATPVKQPEQQIIREKQVAQAVPPRRGTVLSTFRGHSGRVNSVAWSPDGSCIASGGEDKTVHIWTAGPGISNLQASYQHESSITVLAWSPDGYSLAVGTADRQIHLWNTRSGQKLLTYSGHNRLWDGGDTIKALSWSPDSTRIASASGDHSVQVWQAAVGKLVLTYTGHGGSDPVVAVAWSPDGASIASIASSCHAWQATSGRLLWEKSVARSNIIAWSPDSSFIVCNVAGKMKKGATDVQIRDAASGMVRLTYQDHISPVISLACSPDRTRIASADRSIHVWNARTRNCIYEHRADNSIISSLAWSPDSTRIASPAGAGKLVQVWQAS